MSAQEKKVDVVCTRCGTTFSAFLRHMAEHNQKIVCPKCGQEHSGANSDSLGRRRTAPKA